MYILMYMWNLKLKLFYNSRVSWTGIFDMADMLESWRIRILKTALNAGSSKHGKAFLASTKHVNEAIA